MAIYFPSVHRFFWLTIFDNTHTRSSYLTVARRQGVKLYKKRDDLAM